MARVKSVYYSVNAESLANDVKDALSVLQKEKNNISAVKTSLSSVDNFESESKKKVLDALDGIISDSSSKNGSFNTLTKRLNNLASAASKIKEIQKLEDEISSLEGKLYVTKTVDNGHYEEVEEKPTINSSSSNSVQTRKEASAKSNASTPKKNRSRRTNK